MADKSDKEEKPGHFDSNLDDYPGFFELPHPFLDRHMKLWWKEAIEPLKGLTRLDYAFYDGEWSAVVALIQGHGKWEIEGIPVGDLESDSVPSIVKAWVTKEASEYISRFLSPRMSLAIAGII